MNLQCCFYACRIANSKSSIKLAKRQLWQPTKESFSHSGTMAKKKTTKNGKTNAISWLLSPGRVFTEGVATQKKKKLGKKKNSQLRQSLQLFCLMTKVCCRRCATLTMNLALRQRQNKAKARPGYNPVFGPGMKANWFSNSGCGTGVQSQSTTSSRRLLFLELFVFFVSIFCLLCSDYNEATWLGADKARLMPI